MSDCSLHVFKLMVPRSLSSTTLTLATTCDETEPEHTLRAAGRCVEHSTTWNLGQNCSLFGRKTLVPDLYQGMAIWGHTNIVQASVMEFSLTYT